MSHAAMPVLQVFAGARARPWLREHGLRPQDVRVIPAAAGGPKGLVLNPLDRHLFGDWLPRSSQTVHLLGASIGAWRVAAAALSDPDAALAAMAEDYIGQDYPHEPGRAPSARTVSAVFGRILHRRFDGREHELLDHPRYRVHVVTCRGRGLLRREAKLRTALGFAGAWATNVVSRRAMGGWLERVVFGDAREPLPLDLHDYRTRRVALSAPNLVPAILASCSIPFWLDAVHDIPGAPAGAYWDGGITDYHLHLPYASMDQGLVLYPHFQPRLVPGWLDKTLEHRHRATERLANVVVLAPHPDWVRSLPGARLPDRGDFKAFGDDVAGRVRAWSEAVRRSAELVDAFAALASRPSLEALPLP